MKHSTIYLFCILQATTLYCSQPAKPNNPELTDDDCTDVRVVHENHPYLLSTQAPKLQPAPQRATRSPLSSPLPHHHRSNALTPTTEDQLNPTADFDSIELLEPQHTNIMAFPTPQRPIPPVLFGRQITPSPSESPSTSPLVPSPKPLRRNSASDSLFVMVDMPMPDKSELRAFTPPQLIATTHSPVYTARPTIIIPDEKHVAFSVISPENEEATSPFHALHQRAATPYSFHSQEDLAKITLTQFFRRHKQKLTRRNRLKALTCFCVYSPRSPQSRLSFYEGDATASSTPSTPSTPHEAGYITPLQRTASGTYNYFDALQTSSSSDTE